MTRGQQASIIADASERSAGTTNRAVVIMVGDGRSERPHDESARHPTRARRMTRSNRRRGQTLLIDADDTLWENNVYFERVIEVYVRLMAVRGHAPDVARDTLHDIERIRTTSHGYGIRNFHASLREACTRLLAPDTPVREHAAIAGLCAELARESPIVLEGVPVTLRALAGRHRLILFTKGDYDDQHAKLQRAGLRRFFRQIDVVDEKDDAAYRHAVTRHGIEPASAWMAGNSPKSDVLPALACGIGAVFIPHAVTWALERCEIPQAGERLIVLERFGELEAHF